jgi:hypothetical protein
MTNVISIQIPNLFLNCEWNAVVMAIATSSTVIIIITKHGDLKLCREGSFVHGVRAKKYAVKDVALLCYAVGAVRSFTC